MKIPVAKILGAMFAAFVLYGAYALYTGVAKFAGAMSHFAWRAFPIACALAFFNYLIRFLKWEFYLARLEIRGIPKLDSLLTFFSGFVLTVTPGKVGEVFKSFVLAETYGVPMARTAPIVLAERITDLIGIIVLIAFGSLGIPGGLLWAAIGSVLVATLLAVLSSRRLTKAILGVITRHPRGAALGPKLDAAYESLAILVRPRNLVLPTLLSIVAWMLECLSLWVILRGFGADVSLTLATFFYATSTLMGAIVPVPGGLGVTETSLKAQMQALGHVEPATSSAAMMLVRFATLWFAVLVGFASYGILTRKFPKLGKGA